MEKTNDLISNILHNSKTDDYSILTYIDINKNLSDKFIENYMNTLIINNPILTKTIIKIHNNFYLKNTNLCKIKTQYIKKYTHFKNFNKQIKKIISKNFKSLLKWYCIWCIDTKLMKTRLFFKIHHAYSDGYNLIKILMSPFFTTEKYISDTNRFKRSTNNLYYIFFGFFILIILHIKFFINVFLSKTFNKIEDNHKIKTDFIICKSLNLNTIKKFSKLNNLTINDFLYMLMIKTDYLYSNTKKTVSTISSINVSNNTKLNNMCPIFNIIYNAHDDKTLGYEIHNTFNLFKYSLFIPVLSFLLNNISTYCSIDVLSSIYKDILHSNNYVYSNIIGPNIKNLSVEITDIHFLTNAKNNEIIYNIISCNENINIICSFKEGIIKDKISFEKCLYLAYENLLHNKRE